MDDVATALSENEQAKRIREKILQWDAKDNPLAPITQNQQELCDRIEQLLQEQYYNATDIDDKNEEKDEHFEKPKIIENLPSDIYKELYGAHKNGGITSTLEFLQWYDRISDEKNEEIYEVYNNYIKELESRSDDCQLVLDQIDSSLDKLKELETQYDFVSNKTSSLNGCSEQLTDEQKKLNDISEEIQRRLYYFNQAEHLSQRLQSPTLSVASDSFRDCLNKIDECLEYMRQNPKFKESSTYTIKYKHCLAKAVTMMKNYVTQIMSQATEQILSPRKETNLGEPNSSDAAFALYYGKFQTTAIKIKKISIMIEERIGESPEYENLLSEIHQNYLTERSNIMNSAVDKAIKDLKDSHKGDHCTLMRSACAFLVHVCQDEHRLFYQFFTIASELLNSYLETLCTILYDSLRPFIIHINHLETLVEICSILRTEMLEEHVQQNPDSLEAFGKTAFQLLQDVQERLVFRAHLYLQSDILNYNPSAGDLAYPDKLEMMESIALSLQEPQLKRSDSVSSMTSTTIPDNESIVDHSSRGRFINSPADLHGMWYPTVRRTLICLSRLYRCVDRPIFQGLSQEALKYCIQSVSNASKKISANKSPIDGELFEIKHLLILREQIAPFRVDFTVKETTLDFSKVKTAAYGLLHKRKQLFAMNSNNALLEFLLDGTPQVKEQLLDSRKDVDRQLKSVCEQFIKDAVQTLVGPVLQFLDRAQLLLAGNNEPSTNNPPTTAKSPGHKINYQLRQSQWASPQQISVFIQESQRLIKNKLSGLQRSMQLYLSNRDTEFIIFRPIRNNIINSFVKLEQILMMNGYTQDDMIITSCPSAEQVSILLSSASILADGSTLISARKLSTSSNTSHVAVETNPSRKISVEKKVSFDESTVVHDNIQEETKDCDEM